MDFLHLDFAPESFDAVDAMNRLLHVPDSDLPAVLEAVGRARAAACSSSGFTAGARCWVRGPTTGTTMSRPGSSRSGVMRSRRSAGGGCPRLWIFTSWGRVSSDSSP